MSFRVTNVTQLAQAQRNLQASKARLNELNNEAASGLKLTVPSDDPSGTANLLAVQRQIAQNAQYSRNASDGSAWLSSVDSTLTSVTQGLTQLRDLTIQASNGTNNAQSESAISAQMQTLKQHLLSLANTQYLGRNIFAAGSDNGAAFNSTNYDFQGGTPAPAVLRRVGADTTVRVDADGGAVFGSGSSSMFALIDSITTTMAAGGNPSSALTAIDGFASTIQGIHATVGANQQQLQQASSSLQTEATSLTSQQSNISEADPADVILQLQTQQVAYQTALAVTAKSIQPTLMDYLQ